ncbi:MULTISPECIES: hypothetical protein [unclassified Geodermatophilus]
MGGTDPGEQPGTQPGTEDEGSHASVGQDPAREGGGRTGGETSVDEAMGQEAEPQG